MKNQPISNDSVVLRNLKWQEKGTGLVTVLRPCLGNSRIGKRISTIFQFDDYRIKLDQVGSAVWKSCNGKTRIEEIKDKLAGTGEYGLKVENIGNRCPSKRVNSLMIISCYPET